MDKDSLQELRSHEVEELRRDKEHGHCFAVLERLDEIEARLNAGRHWVGKTRPSSLPPLRPWRSWQM